MSALPPEADIELGCEPCSAVDSIGGVAHETIIGLRTHIPASKALS
jgi:hypothetical protein